MSDEGWNATRSSSTPSWMPKETETLQSGPSATPSHY